MRASDLIRRDWLAALLGAFFWSLEDAVGNVSNVYEDVIRLWTKRR